MTHQPPRPLSPGFLDAFAYALEMHGDQARKGGDIPYIAHLMAVCSLVLEAGGDEEQAIAALLHDAPEDRGGQAQLDRIGERFGSRVRDIVLACTDTLAEEKEDWRPRKEAYIDRLVAKERDDPALLVSLADKVHNARSILFDLRVVGEELWTRFKGRPSDTLWYYATLVEAFAEKLPDDPLVAELTRVVDEIAEQMARFETHPFGGGLRILGTDGATISQVQEWFDHAPPAGGLGHWKGGRSVKELAKAWVGTGAAAAPEPLVALLDENAATRAPAFGAVRPEARLRLDQHAGNTRNADLLAYCRAGGRPTVLTIEAKADEAFGPRLAERLDPAKLSKNSKVPVRVAALCQFVFGDGDQRPDLRYQLLHGLAATVMEAQRSGAEQAVFVVHTFSAAANPQKVIDNKRDFDDFVRAVGGEPTTNRLTRVRVAGSELPLFVGYLET